MRGQVTEDERKFILGLGRVVGVGWVAEWLPRKEGVELGMTSADDVAQYMGTNRWRVLDMLRRLTKKGYVVDWLPAGCPHWRLKREDED